MSVFWKNCLWQAVVSCNVWFFNPVLLLFGCSCILDWWVGCTVIFDCSLSVSRLQVKMAVVTQIWENRVEFRKVVVRSGLQNCLKQLLFWICCEIHVYSYSVACWCEDLNQKVLEDGRPAWTNPRMASSSSIWLLWNKEGAEETGGKERSFLCCVVLWTLPVNWPVATGFSRYIHALALCHSRSDVGEKSVSMRTVEMLTFKCTYLSWAT